MNNTKEKCILSVIIPVYNTSAFIEQCLFSLLNQNIPKSDFEIICIDDGSTDDSIIKIQNISKKFENVILKTNSHKGVSEARNTGLESASGKYVWFVDSDDFIAPDSLQKMLEVISINDSDEIEFLSCSFEDGMPENDVPILFNSFENIGKFNNGTRLFKRKIIAESGLRFKSEISYGEDTLFLFEFREMAFSKTEISHIVYCYRKARESSAISQLGKNLGKWADSVFLSAIEIKTKISSGEYKKKSTYDFFESLRQRIIEILSNLTKETAEMYIEKYKDCVIIQENNGNTFLDDYYSYRLKIHPEEKNFIYRVYYSISSRFKK